MKKLLCVIYAAVLTACGGGASTVEIVPSKLLVLGDSLASTAYPSTTWPLAIKDSYEEYYNLATPAELLEDTVRKYRDGSPVDSSYTVIVITGTNNLIRGDSANYIFERLEWLIKDAGSKKARAIVATVSAGADIHCWSDWCFRERLALNDLIRKNFVPLDLDRMFPDPTDTNFYLPDKLHFNERGNAAIAAILKGGL